MISEAQTWILLALALIAAPLVVALVRTRSLFAIAMMLGAFAILVGLALIVLDAPDLAFVETIIFLAVVTPLFLGALTLTARSAVARRARWSAAAATAFAGLLLVWVAPDLPGLGAKSLVAGAGEGQVYVNRAWGEGGLRNAVTAVAMNYRAIDALLATVSIFASALGAYAILGFGERSALRRPSPSTKAKTEERA